MLTIADKLLEEDVFSFPTYKSAVGFSSLNVEQLKANRLDNYKRLELDTGFTLYAGGVDATPAETEAYIEGTFKGVVYKDTNKNGLYDKNIDKLIAKVTLVVSYDGAQLLKDYEDLTDVADNQVIIFLEIPKTNIFSDNVLLLKTGKDIVSSMEAIVQSNWLNNNYTLTEEQRDGLLEAFESDNSYWSQVMRTIVEIQSSITTAITDIGISIFGSIADYFGETLRIPDSFWNADDPEYAIGKAEDILVSYVNVGAAKIRKFADDNKTYLPAMVMYMFEGFATMLEALSSVLHDLLDGIEQVIAFVCGIWNALMDLISGIFGLIKLVFQGIAAVNDLQTNGSYYKALMLEYMDDMLVALIKLDWKKVVLGAYKAHQEMTELVNSIPSLILKGLASLNHTEVGYYGGYIVFQIIEFLFPPLKLAKLGKLSSLSKIADIFTDFAGTAKKVATTTKRVASEVAEDFMNLVKQFVRKLEEGTDSFLRWVQEIFGNMKRWMDDLAGKQPEGEDLSYLFRKADRTGKNEVLLPLGRLKSWGREVEAKYAHLNAKVTIINPYSKEGQRLLRRFEANNALGGFNPGPPPEILIPQKCSELTMRHEIWHLEYYHIINDHAKFVSLERWWHEEWVWDKIWETRSKYKWTREELTESFIYWYRTKSDALGRVSVKEEIRDYLNL